MNRRGALTLSLLLNAALIAVVVWQARRWSVRAASVESAEASVTPARAERSSLKLHPRTEARGSSSGADRTTSQALDWRQIESADYRTYIANLRSVGCPESTIRDIITADVNKLYRERVAALRPTPQGTFHYWETANRSRPTASQQAEIARQTEALETERVQVLAELLGSTDSHAVVESDDRSLDRARKLAFLSTEKQAQLDSIEREFGGIEDQAKTLADWDQSNTNAADRARIMEAYNRKKAAIAQLLTPAELEQYEMSMSWTSQNLRDAMVGFNPTEDEFRAIFQPWRAHDENLAALNAAGLPDPGNAHVYAAIQEALGEERFKQYRRAWWNSSFRELADLAQEFQLPSSTANQVYVLKDAQQSQMQTIAADPSLSPDARAAAIATIQNDTRQAVNAMLGADAFQRYQAGAGRWLQTQAVPFQASRP
jgi:hypothetical protein